MGPGRRLSNRTAIQHDRQKRPRARDLILRERERERESRANTPTMQCKQRTGLHRTGKTERERGNKGEREIHKNRNICYFFLLEICIQICFSINVADGHCI